MPPSPKNNAFKQDFVEKNYSRWNLKIVGLVAFVLTAGFLSLSFYSNKAPTLVTRTNTDAPEWISVSPQCHACSFP